MDDITRVYHLIRQLPPVAANLPQRREVQAAIQAAADLLSPETYTEYRDGYRSNPARANELEEQHPALRLLAYATDQAVADIRRTKVASGLAIWHIYNMGYVFKTPTACFGIDLHLRDADRLAGELDFLLTSHEHRDHYAPELLDAMIAAGKPVVTRWYPGSTVVTEPGQFSFGDVSVKVTIGDHHWDWENQSENMLMFEVDCGPSADNCVIFHCGDNSNLVKIKPTKPVQVFMHHISVGLPVEETIRQVNADYTFPSHLLELAHSPLPPKAWRWSFDYTYAKIKNFSPDRVLVLTWGERWLYPGTTLCS